MKFRLITILYAFYLLAFAPGAALACTSSADCTSDQRCDAHNNCAAKCNTSDHCSASEVCLQDVGYCGQCRADYDCQEPQVASERGPHCNPQTNRCGPGIGGGGEGGGATSTCTSNTDCTTEGQVCDPIKKICDSVQAGVTKCSADTDCGKGMTCSGGTCAIPAAAPPAAPATVPFTAINPTLMIPIPTLNLGDMVASQAPNGDITLPYIAVYIVAIYKYGVAMAAVLAVIMVMVGGFRWLIAAGNAAQITEAKTMIMGAVVGLILAFGSYTALQMINPQLTALKPLTIKSVITDTLDLTDVYGEGDEGDVTSAPNTSNGAYDNIFKAYASCYNLDWRVLKAIASAESGLNATKTNGNHIGLFQENSTYCSGKLGKFPFLSCGNLADPEVNTAAAAATVSSELTKIQSMCPGSDLKSQLLLLYCAHNNGPGVMNYVIKKGGCDSGSQLQYVRQFYSSCADNNPKFLSSDGTCSGSYKGVTADKGQTKWEYGQNVVNAASSLGVTSGFVGGGGSCPTSKVGAGS